MAGADQDLDSFFPYQLAVAAETFSRSLSEVYGQGHGLSREEWRMLFLLVGEAEVTSTDLARRTTLDKVQVSRAAQRLAAKGLIVREISERDRRLRVFRCTDRGRALFEKLLPMVECRAVGILDRLAPEDRIALMQGLAALLAVVAPATDAAPGTGLSLHAWSRPVSSAKRLLPDSKNSFDQV